MTARDDEPAPLAEGARRIVNAARPFERLPPDRKARVRGRVMAAVAAGVAVSAVATEAAAAGAGATAGATTALEAGAGAGGALGSAGLGAATKAAGVSLFAKIGLSVALVTAGAGGWLWNRAQQEPSPSPARPVATLAAGPSASPGPGPTAEPGATSAPAVDPSAPAATASNTVSGFSAVTVPATPPGGGADKPQAAVDPASSSTAVDSLQEETRLLAAAHAALSRGDAASALVLIDEHAARFPSGVLAPERRAARAMALCKQGRAADGQREADALYGEGSKSPVAEKIRRACAK